MAERMIARRKQTADSAPVLAHSAGHSMAEQLEATLQSGGQRLDAATRAFMEPRFGHDFSQVRVHTDERAVEAAESVSALAYTIGSEIVFAAGHYSPATAEGQRLIAHELTHVVQQDAGAPQGTDLNDGIALSSPFDGSERAAEAAAEAVSQGRNAAAIAHAEPSAHAGAGGVTVQRDEDDDRLKLQTFPPGIHMPIGPLGLSVTPGKTSLDFQQGLFNAGAEYQYGGPASLSLGYGAPLLPWRSDLEGDVNAGAAGLAGLAGGGLNLRNLGALSNALSTLGDVNEAKSNVPWGIGLQGQYSPEQWRIMMGLRLNF
jgi:hypothetical protein